METNESKNESNMCGIPNNMNVSDIDEETNIKLRGDAIGSTLYSQSFVLKTLLQFSDIKWNNELEEDLCFLWDMTVEKDVCTYLFEISYPSLACSTLEKCSDNRFIEIVVGILANILCSDCEKTITEAEINIVLRELDTDDHLVLIQVVRFISALAHTFNELPFITKDVVDKLVFILFNSTNNELLVKTLEALAKLMTEFKLYNNLISVEVVKASLTAYKSVISELDEFGFDTRDKQLCCRYMLENISNYCAYIGVCEDKDLLTEFRNCSNLFINEIIKILDSFSREVNLLPVTDDFVFYMSAIKFILETLNINDLSNIIIPVAKILYILADFKDEVVELFDTLTELELFLISNSHPDILIKDLKNLSKSKVEKVITVLSESQQKFYLNLKLQSILDKLK